jgi:hypothetical protein
MSDSESDGESQITHETASVSGTYDDKSIKVRKVRSDKGKKERTPAQIAATTKALSVLKERREKEAADRKERMEKATDAERQRILAEKYEKTKLSRKKLPPVPSYVTLGDFERFKNELLGAMPKEVYKAVEIERKPRKEHTQPVAAQPIPQPIPQPVAQPIYHAPVQAPKQLSGSALLDKMFNFN